MIRELLSIGFIFNLCLFKIILDLYSLSFFNLSPLVLKTVENLGVSYVKGTEQYQSKLEAELRKLKFSYRVSNRKSQRENGPFRLYVLMLLSVGYGKGLLLDIGFYECSSDVWKNSLLRWLTYS